jgi:predicted ATPase
MYGEELHDNGMTDEEMIVHLNLKFARQHLRLCNLERRAGLPEGEYSQCTTTEEIVEADERIQERIRRLERHYTEQDREAEEKRKRNWKPYI